MHENIVGVMDEHHTREMLQASAMNLGKRCGAEAVQLLQLRLTTCLESPESDSYSYIGRRAIEPHDDDDHSEGFKNALIDGVRDSLLGCIDAKPEEAKELTRNLLLSQYPTITRIGLYVCGERYGILRDVFWENFKTQWFVQLNYWHEVFGLIKKSAGRFSKPEGEKFLEEVARAVFDPGDDDDATVNNEQHRRDLLHPAFQQGDVLIDSQYRQLVHQHGEPDEGVDKIFGQASASFMGERSPYTAEQILAKPVTWLLEQVSTFVPSGAFGGTTRHGFGESLSAAIRLQPNHFVEQLDQFCAVPPVFQYAILRGLRERWAEDKQAIDWAHVLEFATKVIHSDSFRELIQEATQSNWEPDARSFLFELGDVIKSGANDSKREMPQQCLNQSLDILKIAMSNCEPASAVDVKDPVSLAINSPWGRLMEAYINVALALRRHEVASGESSSPVWEKVNLVFEQALQASERGDSAEFASLCGLYCSNLHYINADWVEANFDRMFPIGVQHAWSCAAQGLSYQRYLYQWLFDRLKAGGHMDRMIFTDQSPDQVRDRAIQFLGLAYLQGFEPLGISPAGLLDRIIAQLKVPQLKALCWYFWANRGTADAHRSSVLALWHQVHQSMVASGHSHPNISGSLVQLTAFIDSFTPSTKAALLHDAPHAKVGHHTRILLTELTRLVEHNARDVFEILIAALDAVVPEYEMRHVKEIVRALAGC